MTSTEPVHTETETHAWKVNVVDHPQRADSPEYVAARKQMNEIAAQAPGLIYGTPPYQDHHGGALWLKDAQGWFLVRNLAGIEWSAQFCADPAKVDLLRQNAKRLYDLLAPEIKQQLDPGGLLDKPIGDAAGVASWTDSIFNAGVPLQPTFHTGTLAGGSTDPSAPADLSDPADLSAQADSNVTPAATTPADTTPAPAAVTPATVAPTAVTPDAGTPDAGITDAGITDAASAPSPSPSAPSPSAASEPAGVHHYPTPIVDIQLFKYDDFQLWVTDGQGNPAAVAPVAPRGSGNAAIHVLYATPGSQLAQQKQAAESVNAPLILGPDHPLAQQAFSNQQAASPAST